MVVADLYALVSVGREELTLSPKQQRQVNEFAESLRRSWEQVKQMESEQSRQNRQWILSMSFKVSTTAEFESDAKILQKRHRSFQERFEGSYHFS